LGTDLCGRTMKVMDVISEWVSWWLLFSPGILVFNPNLQSSWRNIYSLFALMNGGDLLSSPVLYGSSNSRWVPSSSTGSSLCLYYKAPPHYRTKGSRIAAIPSAPPPPRPKTHSNDC
jgi:hypothetical protein